MLTAQELTLHLIGRGLLTAAQIEGGFRLISRRRNHWNYEVLASGTRGYFVKEARYGDADLDVEASFYRDLVPQRELRHLRRYLPSFRDYDGVRRVLVLGRVDRARDVSADLVRSGREGRRAATELGNAVAAIHESRVQEASLSVADVPWILTLPAPPLQLLRDISAANLELLRVVQKSLALCRCLDQLNESWRATCVTHNDLRFANCIRSGKGRGVVTRIIDWELAGFGDEGWDVGCVFAAFLSLWLASLSGPPSATAAVLMRSATVPISRIQPLMFEFWSSYCRRRRLSLIERDSLRIRAVRFAAARLIQSAYEQLTSSAALSRRAVLMLQVAANIAQRPHVAASSLLGLRS